MRTAVETELFVAEAGKATAIRRGRRAHGFGETMRLVIAAC